LFMFGSWVSSSLTSSIQVLHFDFSFFCILMTNVAILQFDYDPTCRKTSHCHSFT
jgi:hypothetical protein